MKKDFTALNTAPVYNTIAQATSEEPEKEPRKERRTYEENEKETYLRSRQTQGRKGVKAKRINVAFDSDVYDYIYVMAHVRGESLTNFINHVLRDSMEDNYEIYAKAIEFKNSL